MSVTPKVHLKAYADKRLKNGHLWVFSNELSHVPKDIPIGSIVEVMNGKGTSFGLGFYNPNSLISVRLLNTHAFIDEKFFFNRINQALEFRKMLFPNIDNYRLIFGESDGLPGLVVDRYGDYLSIQSLSSGIEVNMPIIIDALLKAFPNTKGIIAKNISRLRLIENLEQKEEVLYGEIPEEIFITENGVKLSLNLVSGQKTGYFLDQKVNRKFLQSISKGKSVLDCFCNQGGFALNSALAGASKALGIDSSKDAIASSLKNKEINNFTNVDFQVKEVFDYLEKGAAENEKWDIIVLDPPAFAKKRKEVGAAKHGYSKINRLALEMLNNNGILISSSCSQAVEEETFLELITREAAKQRKQLQLVFRGGQSPCHPILMSMPETNYLKFFAFKVIEY